VSFDAATLDAYLDRLGWGGERPPAPTLDNLRALHLAHLRVVPFENLSIHLGEPIVLDEAALVSKVVDRRRGGFCYELNGAFAALLERLGYQVTRFEAGVPRDDGRPGPAFDHMTLRVDIDGRPWLADVGFGASFMLPLRLDARDDQPDPGGVFRLTPAGEGEMLLTKNGKPEYTFRLAPHVLADYEEMCSYHQTSPESHFTHNSICSLPVDGGRVSVSGRLLIVTRDGERTETELVGDDEVLDAYRRHFGIELDRVPAR
jgi:N-hydroxyarylamine O-acetyltransferase